MTGWLSRLLGKADALSERALLKIDLGIGLFVLVAHGGLLILVRLGKAPEFERQAVWLPVSVAVFAGVVLSSVVALFRESGRYQILRAHSVVLLVGVVCGLVWAVGIVIQGIPTGVNFSWTPGMLTALVFYGVFLFRRQFLLDHVADSLLARDCHVWAAIVALAVDLGVVLRLLMGFKAHFDGLG